MFLLFHLLWLKMSLENSITNEHNADHDPTMRVILFTTQVNPQPHVGVEDVAKELLLAQRLDVMCQVVSPPSISQEMCF